MSIYTISIGVKADGNHLHFHSVEDIKLTDRKGVYLILSYNSNLSDSISACCRLYAKGYKAALILLESNKKLKKKVLGIPLIPKSILNQVNESNERSVRLDTEDSYRKNQQNSLPSKISISDLTNFNRNQFLHSVYGEEIANIILASHSFDDAKREIENKFEESWEIILKSLEIEFSAKWIAEFNISKADSFFVSKFTSIPLFLLIMYLLFLISVRLGTAIQEQLIHYLRLSINYFAPKNTESILFYIYEMITHGFEAVISFTPLLLCMYISLSFLERSGYMARAIKMVDVISSRIGIPGSSFASLITGFGCNVQSIMSTSSITNKEDKIIAIMMAPFIACGARLSVFVLFSSVFFSDYGYNMVFALYLAGISVAICTAMIFKSSNSVKLQYISLPKLCFPNIISVLTDGFAKTLTFIKTAGKMIFILFVCVYFVNTFPLNKSETSGDSMLVTASKKITPLFKPIGIDESNWPAVAAIATGIVAKESIVGTMKAIYGEGEEGFVKMRQAFNGKLGAFCYLLFILLYFPCISVFVAISKQLNYGWATISLLWSNFIAYTVSTIVYQVGLIYIQKPLFIYWFMIPISMCAAILILKYKRKSNAISKT